MNQLRRFLSRLFSTNDPVAPLALQDARVTNPATSILARILPGTNIESATQIDRDAVRDWFIEVLAYAMDNGQHRIDFRASDDGQHIEALLHDCMSYCESCAHLHAVSVPANCWDMLCRVMQEGTGRPDRLDWKRPSTETERHLYGRLQLTPEFAETELDHVTVQPAFKYGRNVIQVDVFRKIDFEGLRHLTSDCCDGGCCDCDP